MNNRHGFTLVEVITAVCIVAIILGAALMTLIASDSAYKRNTEQLYYQQQARNAMERIVRSLRESQSSLVVVNKNGNDRVVFSTPKVSGAAFCVVDQMLVSESSTGIQTPVASAIQRLKLVKEGDSIRIDLSAGKDLARGPSFSLVQVVQLRNE
jgi:prepilin-type N-terminal cleavage/methylation domain-containing protein